MSPWRWWAGIIGEHTYDLSGDCDTRAEAIRLACAELQVGEQFQIVEARSSEAAKHEGSECVPFLRMRNHEVLTVGPSLPSQEGES